MKHLNMPVKSGSEKSITPEDRWISAHSTWSNDEAPGQPFSSFAADDDLMEDADKDDDEESNGEDPDATEESEEDA